MSWGKYLYHFSEGNKDMKNLLGGKGANLAEMTQIGIPVPPGFTYTTDFCIEYLKTGKAPEDFDKTLTEALEKLAEKAGKKFGDPHDPLLVSVRSGARLSMPGMMDTVLNLGLNEQTLQGLIKQTGNERFGLDSYRRFLTIYSDVVMGVKAREFDEILDELKKSRGYASDLDLTTEDLKKLITEYKKLIEKKQINFPDDPVTQLKGAIFAVFNSWNIPRAKSYRKINHIPDDYGTAANVQVMVFGNMGDTSATGVAFTRNPSTGENKLYGEFLPNAQGEDVVAGIRTPLDIEKMKDNFPALYDEFHDIAKKLEHHFKEVQDLEFTIERGTLYLLQTRTGKRTANAAVKIANDFVEEGLIDEKEALLRVSADQIEQLLHKRIDPDMEAQAELLFDGLPASPGAVYGQIVFTSEDVVEWAEQGKHVLLLRLETSPEDIEGMNKAEGIITARGGMTSHAAVVARGMGKCCVAGCSTIEVDETKKTVKLPDGSELHEGDYLTADGSTGKVYRGQIKLKDPEFTDEFSRLLTWADKYRTLKVRTNADTPVDSKRARELGAEGIGLARTEHMFFASDRIFKMRSVILSETDEERDTALKSLRPVQQEDFEGILTEMKGLPVIIRLLDPPLHEFLPKEEDEINQVAKATRKKPEMIKQIAERLKEQNPMLGHRGCRLGITFPSIYMMQVEAIVSAARNVGYRYEDLQIELPLVSTVEEYRILKDQIIDKIKDVDPNAVHKVQIGTMIEVPRACFIADKLAEIADFFSFGTNDLTQTTYGISRDDGNTFIPYYVDHKIFPSNPFQVLDPEGVGGLIEMTVQKARAKNATFEIGICGEHGGDPTSIRFCHEKGLDYVSCSPFRVPVARIAAAQAAIMHSA